MKYFFVLLLLASSCGFLKDFANSGQTHAKMAQRLATHTYDIPLPQMKAKVIEFFEMKHEAPTIVLPSKTNPADGLRAQHGKDNRLEETLLDKGFTYQGRIYFEEVNVEWKDIMGRSDAGLKKLQSLIKTGPFNIVEDTAKSFMIVKGPRVYTGEAVSSTATKLSVRELTKLEFGPASWTMDWGELLTARGLGLGLKSGPVSLEKSLPSAERDELRELSLLHFLDRKTFESWEKETH